MHGRRILSVFTSPASSTVCEPAVYEDSQHKSHRHKPSASLPHAQDNMVFEFAKACLPSTLAKTAFLLASIRSGSDAARISAGNHETNDREQSIPARTEVKTAFCKGAFISILSSPFPLAIGLTRGSCTYQSHSALQTLIRAITPRAHRSRRSVGYSPEAHGGDTASRVCGGQGRGRAFAVR